MKSHKIPKARLKSYELDDSKDDVAKDLKTKTVMCFLTNEQHKKLKMYCTENDISITDWICYKIDNDIEVDI